MFKFIEKLFKRKQDINTIDNTNEEPVEEEKEIRNVDIEVTNEDNFIIFDIKEDCTLDEYMKTTKEKGIANDLLTNHVLFDECHIPNIEQKKVYIIRQENREYQIYYNSSKIYINERTEYPSEDYYIDDRIIRINKGNNVFHITRLKHNSFLSTFYVKFYSSNTPEQKYFHLPEDEALMIAHETIDNLSKVPNIEKIVDMQYVKNCLVVPQNDKVNPNSIIEEDYNTPTTESSIEKRPKQLKK